MTEFNLESVLLGIAFGIWKKNYLLPFSKCSFWQNIARLWTSQMCRRGWMLLQGLSIKSKRECKKSVYSALGGKIDVDLFTRRFAASGGCPPGAGGCGILWNWWLRIGSPCNIKKLREYLEGMRIDTFVYGISQLMLLPSKKSTQEGLWARSKFHFLYPIIEWLSVCLLGEKIYNLYHKWQPASISAVVDSKW